MSVAMKGSALEYMEYEPLYDVEREGAKFHYVVCDSYVTMSDGTGIVHGVVVHAVR